MNTVNQTFNWSRFTAALRKEIVENKRALIFTLVCIYGFLSMIMIFGNLITNLGGEEGIIESVDVMKFPQVFVATVLTFVIIISASLSFKNLTTKAGRTNLFTSPSSTLEKFIINILIYLVGIFVAFFACAQLADLTRIAALWFFRGESLIVPGPINYLTIFNDFASRYEEMGNFGTGMGWAFFISMISSGGTYFMGSVLWPRLSLLKTFAGLYALEFIVFIIAAPLFFLFADMETFGHWMFEVMLGGQLTKGMIIANIALVIVSFGLAWYLFKHKDVVSLKWWK
jgi:hypothetical protein